MRLGLLEEEFVVGSVDEQQPQRLLLLGTHRWLLNARQRHHGHAGHGEVDARYGQSRL
jgi:hypothetical protein